MAETTIFIAEDHLISRIGLKMLLEQTEGFKVIGEAEDGKSAIDSVLKLKPQVIMMDLDLPIISGTEATSAIKKQLPESKVIMFTSEDDNESVFAALEAGADGYCLKTVSGESLGTAIRSVLSGVPWLSPGIASKVLRSKSTGQTDSLSFTHDKETLLSLLEEGKNLEEIADSFKVGQELIQGLLIELLGQFRRNHSNAANAASLDSTISIGPGDTLANNYRIEERIGIGGMGCVYRADHIHIARKVAVKTVHEHLTSEESLLRFKKEAQASAAINHPNLITIYDYGLLEGKLPYIVMEFLDGINLGDLIAERSCIEPPIATKIFAQVCDALSAVHSKSIVHRDLKPSNIMLVNTEEGHKVKLVDFGIAKLIDDSISTITQTGELVGSPAYMSPEQCNSKPLDQRSDIYSLGCVMYETYSGCKAFSQHSAMETMIKQITEPPCRYTLEDAKLPAPLIELIFQMLEKKPDDRPSTTNEIRQRLLAL